MAKYRIYPDKSNTLVEKNPTTNTGLNEVTELWYGDDGIARYFIRFDFSDYETKYAQGLVPHITATTATCVLTTCAPIVESGSTATSFDMEVQVVQQDWDQGIGYNLDGTDIVEGFSCWTGATSTDTWAAAGGDFLYQVFSGHVDTMGSSVSLDVTDEVELWLMLLMKLNCGIHLQMIIMV